MSGFLLSVSDFLARWRLTRWYSILIFIFILASIWLFFFKKNPTAEQYITTAVARGDIENLVTATGILQPVNYVDVGAQVSGQLKKLHVAIGQEVKAGDLLAEIDATVYKAKVDGIRAQLLNQKAQLQDKQAQLTLAKIRVNRQQNLQKDEATTQDSVQAAEASYQSANAQVNVVQAQIQQTEFSLRVEEANLAYARIYAPMNGTVVSITSRQGQTLNTNQQSPTIMRISDLSIMTVQAQVSEADVGKLRVDMPVYFTTLGGKDYRWHSNLNRIQPTPEISNSVVLYSALFDVPNEKRKLMTQMSAQVFFVASQAKDILTIPASAINFQLPIKNNEKEKKDNLTNSETDKKTRKYKESPAEGAQPKPAIVQVMDARGNVSERKVLLGVGNRVQVQVLEGLVEGEKVVSGIRLQESNAKEKAVSGQGAMGASGGAARMMR